ncbi:formylglycine-generating enzyme family protein [Flagellimonas pacifica]|uniref:Formylglycine-generating enzyme, required for sulfatase activity, contains SUMF1/FGE domain n=1 Tax=Flagellimonas pacifica TaxID=1247520 RepID=A0A285MD11_9FLAO|nr:SUMF1/EgtB/PvdO family nonheme iron enzyme [Allomuricauda parva]SNY94583.1 Formylglycine-generating enzyme, required for sulfatase activity, contains SUMF1/FGE domain [Allomuricauda parva]
MKKVNKELINKLLVEVPKGTIEMRDDRIKKTWEVKIDSFYLSKYPTTQALYRSITKENPSSFKGDKLPVETVTWIDAVAFCNKLSEHLGINPCYIIDKERGEIRFVSNADGFRLPTEAEWQYACQCGTGKKRYDGIESIAWYKKNSKNQPHEVGQMKPNAWGLYDMLGNVWEWCSDIYDETKYGEYRVFRGGGWCDVARSVMATTRRRSHPFSFKIDDLGFRIAKNAC